MRLPLLLPDWKKETLAEVKEEIIVLIVDLQKYLFRHPERGGEAAGWTLSLAF